MTEAVLHVEARFCVSIMKHQLLQANDLEHFKSRTTLSATQGFHGQVMVVPYLPVRISLSSANRDGVK